MDHSSSRPRPCISYQSLFLLHFKNYSSVYISLKSICKLPKDTISMRIRAKTWIAHPWRICNSGKVLVHQITKVTVQLSNRRCGTAEVKSEAVGICQEGNRGSSGNKRKENTWLEPILEMWVWISVTKSFLGEFQFDFYSYIFIGVEIVLSMILGEWLYAMPGW